MVIIKDISILSIIVSLIKARVGRDITSTLTKNHLMLSKDEDYM